MNRSLPESSGVMNPKPLSSLNHFTVPVAILFPPEVCALRNAEGADATTAETLGTTLSSGTLDRDFSLAGGSAAAWRRVPKGSRTRIARRLNLLGDADF